MKELNIQVPEGYEIDKDRSTFEKIIFKKTEEKPISWDTLRHIEGYSINTNSKTFKNPPIPPAPEFKNTFKTLEQAEAALALAQLSQLIPEYIKRYYSKNPHWRADWIRSTDKFCIGVMNNEFIIDIIYYQQHFCAFPTEKIAERFFKEQRALLEQAKPFL